MAGTETVTRIKFFSEPPNVPTPVGTGEVTNKRYVDGTVECLNASTWCKHAPAITPQPLA
jgi:hypothetical protein